MAKIFESPDNGQTVYEREFGSIDRKEIKTGSIRQQLKEAELWNNIRKAAPTNPTLQAALDQCIMIYKLSKEYKDV